MKYEFFENKVVIKKVKDFDIRQTLDCGQCFRWNEMEDNVYKGVAFGKELTLYMDDGGLILEGTTLEDFKNIWENYFDFKTDYSKIKENLCLINPVLKNASQYAPGIRILRQEPWEALCSFIISQNNNIPRIKGIVERLCQHFGERVSDSCYSFPSAKVLSQLQLEDLSVLKCGFRDKYILDAAEKVTNKEVDLEKIALLSLKEAEAELLKIKGVGPKVAQCTLLYGFHRLDAFPIDVWMKKAMKTLFPGESPEIFGKYAGIAQQYIFHYSRNHPELFKDE